MQDFGRVPCPSALSSCGDGTCCFFGSERDSLSRADTSSAAPWRKTEWPTGESPPSRSSAEPSRGTQPRHLRNSFPPTGFSAARRDLAPPVSLPSAAANPPRRKTSGSCGPLFQCRFRVGPHSRTCPRSLLLPFRLPPAGFTSGTGHASGSAEPAVSPEESFSWPERSCVGPKSPVPVSENALPWPAGFFGQRSLPCAGEAGAWMSAGKGGAAVFSVPKSLAFLRRSLSLAAAVFPVLQEAGGARRLSDRARAPECGQGLRGMPDPLSLSGLSEKTFRTDRNGLWTVQLVGQWNMRGKNGRRECPEERCRRRTGAVFSEVFLHHLQARKFFYQVIHLVMRRQAGAHGL